MELIERKIGETFEYEGKKIEVKAASSDECDGCFFNTKCTLKSKKLSGECDRDWRNDRKSVIFVEKPQKKIEEIKERKIGEVFEYQGKKIRVKESSGCDGCFFKGRCSSLRKEVIGHCEFDCRTDDKAVIFVEIIEEQPQELNLCEILKDCPEGEPFWSPFLGDVKFYDIDQKRNFIVISLESGETWKINADGTISFGTTTSPEIMLYPSKEQRDWTKVKYEKKKEKFDPKTLQPFDKVLISVGGEWQCDLFSHMLSGDIFNKRCIGVGDMNVVIPYNDETKHLVGTKDEAPEFYKYWEN